MLSGGGEASRITLPPKGYIEWSEHMGEQQGILNAHVEKSTKAYNALARLLDEGRSQSGLSGNGASLNRGAAEVADGTSTASSQSAPARAPLCLFVSGDVGE